MRSGNLTPWDTSGGRGIFVIYFLIWRRKEKKSKIFRRGSEDKGWNCGAS